MPLHNNILELNRNYKTNENFLPEKNESFLGNACILSFCVLQKLK